MKIVNENINDILIPKNRDDVINDLIIIINDFISKISMGEVYEFIEEIYEDEITIMYDLKDLTLVTIDQLDNIIANFLADYNITNNGDMKVRFSRLVNLNLLNNELNDDPLKNAFSNLLREKFAEKFYLEY